MRSAVTILALFCILLQTNVASVESANILGVFPTLGRSHFIINEALMRGLAAAGHNVTVVSAFKTTNTNVSSNYHPIYIELEYEAATRQMLDGILKNPNTASGSGPTLLPSLIAGMNKRSVEMLQHEIMQQIMNSGQKFDLFVFGWMLNDFMMGIGGHFRCPIVVMTTFQPIKSVRDLVGNPTAVESAPLIDRNHGREPMTFLQRVVEFLFYTAEFIVTKIVDYYVHEPHYREYFPAEKGYPTFDEVKQNVSLLLINDHFSQGKPRPYLPNMIEVSGIHMKYIPDPLPEKLRDFIDNAEHGAILFSLGTNARFSEMNEEKMAHIFTAIAKLKQRVIMKWETKVKPHGVPSNVMLMDWLPQGDILAHPNTRIFISHCGLSSVNEAKFHGVPILGIPIFGDQLHNAATVSGQGWAISVPYTDLNEKSLNDALHELLTNSTYRDVVQQKSLRYRDRPQTALETAVFWTEYVIRHDGAYHLKSDTAFMNVWQKNSYDVIGFLFVVAYVLWRLVKVGASFAWKLILRKFRPALNKVKVN